MHGGRLLAKALAAQGVRRIFGLCGDHINAIFEGCADEGISILDTRTEAGAGHMAEGWSFATGDPGVLVVTGGPGLTSAMTPVADAFMAGIPLVVVTSRLRLSEHGRGYPQDIDHMAFAKPLLVWARTVFDAARIPDEVAEAFLQARARRGPVLLELPMDVQLAGAPEIELVPPLQVPAAQPSSGALASAAAVLAAAQRPVAVVGEGAFWSGAADALRRFTEGWRVPVFTVRAARGLLPDMHDLCFGPPNYFGGAGQLAFAQADVLIVVGCELDITLAFGGIAAGAKLVRIDPDPARVARNRRPEVAIVCDEAAGLAGLADRAERRAEEAWLRELRAAADDDARQSAEIGASDEGPVHPARLVRSLARAAPTATFAVDAGELALWGLQGLPAAGAGRVLSSIGTPFSTLGPGIPFAIAAKLARPDEPSVALVGDGAFGYSGMEIDTASRHGVAITTVVGNDAAWGIVKHQMELGFGRSIAATLAPRRYDLLAETLGASAEHVDTGHDLEDVLQRALSADRPAVVDVTLDPMVQHPAMKFVAAMFAPEH
jgi:thiamine pyrophosphate-dependent acetolactate synthase large subunit-like protein